MCALPRIAILILALLPKADAVPGWVWREEPRKYSPQALYEYIDGSADLYLAYGFKEAAVGDYVASGGGGGWITVDIYDMGAPLHAFGVYGAEKPPGVQPFAAGAQGYLSEGMIALWQDSYYVKVMLIEGKDAAAARALAKAVAEKLPRPAEMPVELRLLPTEGRIADSERYVKTSALGHKFLVEVVSAEYKVAEATATFHVADLGTAGKATEGWSKLREFEKRAGGGPEGVSGVGEEAFAARDSYYDDMIAARQGQFVVIAMSEKAPRSALAALIKGAVPLLAPRAEARYCPAQ